MAAFGAFRDVPRWRSLWTRSLWSRRVYLARMCWTLEATYAAGITPDDVRTIEEVIEFIRRNRAGPGSPVLLSLLRRSGRRRFGRAQEERGGPLQLMERRNLIVGDRRANVYLHPDLGWSPGERPLLGGEEDGITDKSGGHSPQPVCTGRDGHTLVPLGYAAFVQLSDVIDRVGDDSASAVVRPVIHTNEVDPDTEKGIPGVVSGVGGCDREDPVLHTCLGRVVELVFSGDLGPRLSWRAELDLPILVAYGLADRERVLPTAGLGTAPVLLGGCFRGCRLGGYRRGRRQV